MSTIRRFLDTESGIISPMVCDDEGVPLAPVAPHFIKLEVETLPELVQNPETGEHEEKLVTDYRFPMSAYRWLKKDCGLGESGPREPRILGTCMKCDAKIKDTDDYDMYAKTRPTQTMNGYEIICKKCVAQFVNCKNCGHIYLPEDLTHENCPTCVHKAPKSLIKNYTFRVEQDLGLIHGPKPPLDELFYGVELELESANYGLDTLIVSELTNKFARLKKDASIEQGFEIVTAPCSIDMHYTLWDDFFEKVPETVHPLRTCGMHVHVSRVRMSNLQIGKMLIFLHNPENRSFVRWVAGRESSYHNNYETPKKIGDGANGGILPQNADRHTALNLNGGKTIEFRIFKSTKDKRALLKNIEFCKALIKFTDWGAHSVEEAKDHRVFFKYVMARRKEYAFLSSYLKDKVAPILKLS